MNIDPNFGWETSLSLVANELTRTIRQRQGVTLLRPVFMNAVEVGYSYAHCDRDKKLNVRGVTIALWYFICRGHQAIALLPYCFKNYAEKTSRYGELMMLYRLNLVEFTPGYGSEKYAEVNRIMVNRAFETGGCIVARSQMQGITDNKANLINLVEQRLLMPTFNGDDIMFPIDGPLGRNGPTLKQTLECEQGSPDWRSCSEHQLLLSDQKHWMEKLSMLVPEKVAWTRINQLVQTATITSPIFDSSSPGSDRGASPSATTTMDSLRTSASTAGPAPPPPPPPPPPPFAHLPPLPPLPPMFDPHHPMHHLHHHHHHQMFLASHHHQHQFRGSAGGGGASQAPPPLSSSSAAHMPLATPPQAPSKITPQQAKNSMGGSTSTSTQSCGSRGHLADCQCLIDVVGTPPAAAAAATSTSDRSGGGRTPPNLDDVIPEELIEELRAEERRRKIDMEMRKKDELLAKLAQIFGFAKAFRVMEKYKNMLNLPQLVEKCIQEPDMDGDDAEFVNNNNSRPTADVAAAGPATSGAGPSHAHYHHAPLMDLIDFTSDAPPPMLDLFDPPPAASSAEQQQVLVATNVKSTVDLLL